MRAETTEQKSKTKTWITIKDKKPGYKIQFLNCVKPECVIICPDHFKKFNVSVYIARDRNIEIPYWRETKRSYLRFMWLLPPDYKHLKKIRITDNWTSVSDKSAQVFNFIYDMNQVISKPSNLKNNDTTLKQEFSNNVKVTCENEAIIVKGVLQGENI